MREIRKSTLKVSRWIGFRDRVFNKEWAIELATAQGFDDNFQSLKTWKLWEMRDSNARLCGFTWPISSKFPFSIIPRTFDRKIEIFQGHTHSPWTFAFERSRDILLSLDFCSSYLQALYLGYGIGDGRNIAFWSFLPLNQANLWWVSMLWLFQKTFWSCSKIY